MPKPYQRTRNLFDPAGSQPFRLSRSKLELFLKCPRCFYLDRRLGVGQPSGPPFTLNNAVDLLLKREFDVHRLQGLIHPYMQAHGLECVPWQHEQLDHWRDALRGGIQYHHPATNFLITGGIDDIWVNRAGELHIVDYKATAKAGAVSLDADWQISYKRQMELYQWLFRSNGFRVHEVGYFVYCNGDLERAAFDNRLEFRVTVLPYAGQTSWIEDAITNAHRCLMSEALPEASPACEFCAYRAAAQAAERGP